MKSKIKRRRKYLWRNYYHGLKKRRIKWKCPLKIRRRPSRRIKKKDLG